ncbi:hypothetical protein JZ751_028125 [Albula glossodonta]|uniref:Uncharacterized protein n=1 Tax=Albula glossodonta TaxID=121402 RepID=A0A8T2PKX9_9TELE|nr:hypothetical protein JZ751_028125 [Albula glossodonta]
MLPGPVDCSVLCPKPLHRPGLSVTETSIRGVVTAEAVSVLYRRNERPQRSTSSPPTVADRVI